MTNARFNSSISFNAGTFAPKKYDRVTHQYEYPLATQTTVRFFNGTVFMSGVIITHDGAGREIESKLIIEDV